MKKIGVFGGTFNPIHFGHLIVAEEVRELYKLDKVLFIPTGIPPHKDEKDVAGVFHRYNMTKLAVCTNEYFDVSRIEIDRSGFSYTVDTLTELINEYGSNTKLYWIIGADVIFDLLTWKKYQIVFSKCEFIVVKRPGYQNENLNSQIEHLISNYSAKINTANTSEIGISSTKLRQKVASFNSIKYFVPDAVAQYITKNKLYN